MNEIFQTPPLIMTKYVIDNIQNCSTTRGWICGHFLPEGHPMKTSELEVKYSVLQPGETQGTHFHPQGTEINFIIHGKVKYLIGGEERILSDGDFVFMRSNVDEAVLEVYETTTMLSARTPSLPENKVIKNA